MNSCDLHLGDSQLQFYLHPQYLFYSCDLHLGDSQLQSKTSGYVRALVVICI